VSKIKSLTKKQEKLCMEFKKKWWKIGTSTESADRPLAETSINKLYSEIGNDSPEFIWAKSPYQVNFLIHLFKNSKFEKEHKHLSKQKVKELIETLTAREDFESYVVEYTGSSPEFENTLLLGSLDSSWICFYLFCREIGVKYETDKNDLLNTWSDIAKSAFWWYPFEHFCFVSERPTYIGWNDEENPSIHCETGPAVSFSDGYEIFAINGVVVERYVVMETEKITIEDINSEENAEVKRIKVEQMGYGEYLSQTGAEILDTDTHMGTLRALMKDSEDRVYLCGTDGSTERVYYMPVPNTMKTCKEASRALSGFDESDLQVVS